MRAGGSTLTIGCSFILGKGAFGAGGGSGFAKMSSLSIVGLGTTAIYTGFGSATGLDTDSDRGDYGRSGQPGKVMFLGF